MNIPERTEKSPNTDLYYDVGQGGPKKLQTGEIVLENAAVKWENEEIR